MSTASPELSEIVVAAQEIEFWRKACPSLRLSDLYQAPAPPADLSESELEGLARDLGQEGYFITRELIQASARAELLGLVDQVVARGLNPTWAMIFDPFWDTFARLGGLLEHLLGEDYRYVTGDYVFIVENTDQAAGWGKHRDLQFRRSMSRNGHPLIMSFWVALTDATPLNSCLYALPFSRDPNYPDNIKDLTIPHVEDVQCMAVQAGQVIGLSHALLHWGSRSSARGKTRRVSFVFDAQRGDLGCFHEVLLDPKEPLSFEQRAAYVAHVVLWLRRNNVRFNAFDQALAESLVARYGSTIGLRERFYEVYVAGKGEPGVARYAATAAPSAAVVP